MVDYLGEEELEGTLGKPVEGIGEGSTQVAPPGWGLWPNWKGSG